MYSVMKWTGELQVLKNKIAIVLAGQIDIDLNLYLNEQYYIIAVDGGLNHLIDQEIDCDILIGDMDSIGDSHYKGKQIVFDTVKDDTDFICAIKYAKQYNAQASIEVFGFASLNRLDHVIANISAIKEGMKLISNNQEISLLTKNTTVVRGEYTYYSFYALTKVDSFSLLGFKYPLNDYCLEAFDPLCVSNELNEDYAEVKMSNGRIVLIKSKSN